MDKIEEDSVVCQVSFAGFDRNVKALELTDFLENEIGPIWRCRLKTSWTPPESYPDFNITNMEAIQRTDDYEKVVPHAFVHFVSPDAETTALNTSEHSELVLNQHTLKVNLGPDNQFHTNQKRKVQTFKIPDAHIEIGSLISPDEFLVCWKGPTSGVDFLVDPFDATCKIYFTKETAFSVKGTTRHAVIKCDFKMEFSVTQINCIKQYEDTSSLIILLQLASSPFVYYRTAADDIYDMGLIDRLHDEDPWIRTTDFTPSKVLGRSSYYKISVPAFSALRLYKAMNYLREHRIPEDHPGELPRIRDELNFGMPMLDHFFSSCGEQGNTAAMLLTAGFKPQTEPHLKGMLSCIRAAQLGGLREKARIFVPSGRWLMGCLDELGILEEGQCFIQVSTPSLENSNPKHGSRFSGTEKNVKVINGIVAIAKNPCLHPGDVRILEAIDVPALHHLVDCLVFPQKGERPHTNEASGSDLDGDQYFATWDESLIPPGKRSCPPMDYAPFPQGPKEFDRDRISFFMKAMTNEKLGIITNAHVALADQSEDGALDKKCIQLAELAATAVDFPKTGKIVTIPSPLKPKTYPDFMGKDEHQSYKSNKILGKLFRQIKDGPKEDMSVTLELTIVPEDIPYDADLEVPGSEDFIMDAWGHKCSYDRQLSALLEQYKVNREEEVVTGYVWSMPKYSNKKKAQLKERLKHAYNALKKEFRQVFETMEQDFQQLTNNEKNAMYEQKASAWYQVAYHPKWVKNALDLKESEGNAIPTMLSFAWIPANYLAQIKIRNRGVDNINSRKPIDTLTG